MRKEVQLRCRYQIHINYSAVPLDMAVICIHDSTRQASTHQRMGKTTKLSAHPVQRSRDLTFERVAEAHHYIL